MNTTTTFDRLDKTIGRYALAGSLLLHLGFVALFYSSQWNPIIPAKEPLKIINVNFIPATEKTKTRRQTESSPLTSTSPETPIKLQSAKIWKTKPRTQKVSSPKDSSFKATPRLLPVTHVQPKLPKKPKAILPDKPRSTTSARPFSLIPINPGASGLKTARSPETLAPAPAESKKILAAQFSPAKNIRINKISQAQRQYSPITTARIQDFHSQAPSHTPGPLIPKTVNPLPGDFYLEHEDERKGPDLGILRGIFTGKVRQRIAQTRVYPKIAKRRGIEGQPVISFTLDRGGRLIKVQLVSSSGFQLLDNAALNAVKHAAPFPEIPSQLNLDSLQFKLPISFILK